MIENDIRIYLLAQTPISQLLGVDATGAPAKLFPIDRQQGSGLPAIAYERIGTVHDQTLDAAAGHAVATIQFDCMAASYGGAKLLAETLRGELDGFRGTMGNQQITSCRIQDEDDDFDEPEDASGKGTYHVTVIYDIRFTESVPTFA